MKVFPIVERVRYLAVVSVVFSLLGAALMTVIGAARTIKSFQIYFLGAPVHHTPTAAPLLDTSDYTMIAVVESVDAFLIGIALMIFAMGVHSLFIREVHLPGNWLRINSIGRLKQVIMEVVMVVLTVLFLRALFLRQDLGWQLLVVPVSVALFAVAIKLVDWRSPE